MGNGSHARSRFGKMSGKIFAQHFVATPFGALNLLVDACAFRVPFCNSQVSLPQATSLRVGALYLEAP